MLRVAVKLFPLKAAVFVIAFVGLLTGSRSASAGCGDYVHLGHDLDHSQMAGVQPLHFSQTSVDTRRERPIAPCQGPNCRGQSPPAAPPAPPPSVNGPDLKALLSAVVRAAPESPRTAPCTKDMPVKEVCGVRIERPPRDCP